MAQFWKPGAEKPADVAEYGEEDVPMLLGSYGGSGYMNLEKERKRLPVFKQRDAILYLVETTSTTLVIGETGSGKTTQIPQVVVHVKQYLAEAGWAEGGRLIACTQPRRIAAQMVATRVAEEMRVQLGADVGYSIRFEDVSRSGVTKIKYMTDGVLLREMMQDPLLSRYSVIMVDEAHERSVSTDMLLGLLKKIQRRRPELRLIIASATMDASSMAAFFDTSAERVPQSVDGVANRKPAVVSVEGRSFSVHIHYLEEAAEDYTRAAVSTCLQIHQLEPPGDILLFLTGQDEVDAAVQSIYDESRALRGATLGIVAVPLYAGLPRSDQELVFGPTPRGKRKVIVATNIAETSVTVPGIVYVVDCGFSKQRFYNPETDVEALVTAPISRASAQQRAGRAGRVRPGKCYRLYTEESFLNDMSAEAVPEMQRSNLVNPVLQLKALGIDNIMRFDWPAAPPAEAMVRALELLFAIGVLDDHAKLTSPTGFQVAELPLEPMLSKMLLASDSLGCSQEALTIAATLSVQSIWVSSRGRQKELDEARDRFAVAEGDHVTFLNVYQAFLNSKMSGQWCHQNCINYQAMKKVVEVREQLAKLFRRLGMSLKSCGRNTETVRKAVTCGFFANACQLQTSGAVECFKRVRGGQELVIHPSSVLFRVAPKWVVFHAVMVTERYYMREVTAIEPAWLTELAPHFFQRRQPNLKH